uniref:RanBP2-type domain-containing protein n=1 Tax=Mucochytrium quahogii TaxID=96639 RepID=A0A7S2RV27_9STRA|mmetsp:Transcript_4613/g.8113  ORF Transcript_4613/g.8113 Transcript_4613/m.8113 type:complete len:502 (-) Transcript_4613:2551-4056(-)
MEADLCNEIAGGLVELGIRLQVRACVSDLVDRVEADCAEAHSLELERALRVALAQLDTERTRALALESRIRHLEKWKRDRTTRAEELLDEYRAECRKQIETACRNAVLEKENVECRKELGRWPKRLETISNELAVANQKNMQLRQQVEALISVQKEIQESRWFDNGEKMYAANSTTEQQEQQNSCGVLQSPEVLAFLGKADQQNLVSTCRELHNASMDRVDLGDKLVDEESLVKGPDDVWSCALCETENDSLLPVCRECKHAKPVKSAVSSPVNGAETNILTHEYEEELKKFREATDVTQNSPLTRFKSRFGLSKTAQNVPATGSTFDGLTVEQLRMVLAIDKKCKQTEAALLLRTTEMEDLKARLMTYAQTKRVLVSKLEEVESVLRATIEQRDHYRAQIASDKEVISYLDNKAHELEKVTKLLGDRQAELLREKQDIQQKLKNTCTNLEASAKDAITEKEETQHRLKAEKKLLVKEVKLLRAQVTQLTEDNARYQKLSS